MEKTILVTIGKRVRERRLELGLSQEQLGEKAGFHFSYIGGLERAEKNITVLNLQKIADALDLRIDYLFINVQESERPITEKEKLIKRIIQLIYPLSTKELRKVIVFLTKIIGSSR